MAPAPGHDCFTELPLEMLQHIASYLGAWDELKLRTVFPKTKQQIMVGTLGELISAVYVSPTKTSLEHFCKIAAPSFFAEHIRKLVYIPRALDETIDDLLSVVEARKTCDEFNHIVSEHKTDHSAWSSTIDDFVLKFLRKGLARLQGLKVVVLANNIQDDGLNATALWYCNEYAERRQSLGLRAITAGDPVLSIFHDTDFVQSSLFAVFKAITLAKLNLRNMELGNSLCGQLKFGQEYHGLTRCMDAALDALTYVFPKLRKPTISCSDEWSASMKTEAFWKYIASRSNGIQDLTLYLDQVPSTWKSSLGEDKVFERFLRHGNYPSLHKLQIHGENKSPGMLDFTLIVEFLRRHYDSLQYINLAGVIVSEHSNPNVEGVPRYDGETVCETIRAIVQSVPAIVIGLKSFEMKVHRLDRYKLYHRRWLQVKALDKLAKELGLTPSSANEWDFGQAARKMLKGA